MGQEIKSIRKQFRITRQEEKQIKEIQKYIKKVDAVYLATDPDREGEAIAWHIAHILDLDNKENNRIVFRIEFLKVGSPFGSLKSLNRLVEMCMKFWLSQEKIIK